MKILIFLFIALIFALFGAIHGLRTKELNLTARKETPESKKINARWHNIQAVLHGVIALIGAYHFSFPITFIISFFLFLTLIWITFDLSHNLSTGQDWYYSENKGINGFLKKYVREIGIIAIKGVLFFTLLILYLVL